jgi:hypothetical protein
MRSFAVVFTHADAVDVTLMVLGLGLLGAISYGMSTLPSALITRSSLSSRLCLVREGKNFPLTLTTN